MAEGTEDRRTLIEAADELQAANDSQDVFERLKDIASRGMDFPEGLTSPEVKKLCFALFALIGTKAKK